MLWMEMCACVCVCGADGFNLCLSRKEGRTLENKSVTEVIDDTALVYLYGVAYI